MSPPDGVSSQKDMLENKYAKQHMKKKMSRLSKILPTYLETPWNMAFLKGKKTDNAIDVRRRAPGAVVGWGWYVDANVSADKKGVSSRLP